MNQIKRLFNKVNATVLFFPCSVLFCFVIGFWGFSLVMKFNFENIFVFARYEIKNSFVDTCMYSSALCLLFQFVVVVAVADDIGLMVVLLFILSITNSAIHFHLGERRA